MKFLVSACLAGEHCRFDGSSNSNAEIMKLVADKVAYPACPELLGGLEVPRPRSEIIAGDGNSVLDGKSKVVTDTGQDVTSAFTMGARKFLEVARTMNCSHALLKSKSPACGVGKIFDGSFSGKVKSGDGVAAAIVRLAGLRVSAAE